MWEKTFMCIKNQTHFWRVVINSLLPLVKKSRQGSRNNIYITSIINNNLKKIRPPFISPSWNLLDNPYIPCPPCPLLTLPLFLSLTITITNPNLHSTPQPLPQHTHTHPRTLENTYTSTDQILVILAELPSHLPKVQSWMAKGTELDWKCLVLTRGRLNNPLSDSIWLKHWGKIWLDMLLGSGMLVAPTILSINTWSKCLHIFF